MRSPSLCVKELANSLGASVRFVYQMRACGFPMRGILRNNCTATVKEALAWIEANNFRLVKGVGVTRKRMSVSELKGQKPQSHGEHGEPMSDG